jgi:hypothetical protein
MEFKGTTKLAYYKENAEEDYIKTPISVLRYISELESHIEKSCAPDMLEALIKMCEFHEKNASYDKGDNGYYKAKQLIKKATGI